MVDKKKENVEVVPEKEEEIKEAWDPFRAPSHLGSSIFDDPWTHPWMYRPGWRNLWPGLWFGKDVKEPPIDFEEKKKEYKIYAEIPGIPKDNIEVHVTPHDLAIKGTIKTDKKEKDEKGFIWRERGYSKVARAMHFSEKVNPDKVKAELEDGILEITVPKKKLTPKEKAKKIMVSNK